MGKVALIICLCLTFSTLVAQRPCDTLFIKVDSGYVVSSTCDSMALMTHASFNFYVKQALAGKEAQFSAYKNAVLSKNKGVKELIYTYEKQLELYRRQADTLTFELNRLQKLYDYQQSQHVKNLQLIKVSIDSAARQTEYLKTSLTDFKTALVKTEKDQKRAKNWAFFKGTLVVGVPCIAVIAMLIGFN